MKHWSRHFGVFTYESSQVITFPSGLLGFPDYKHYVLKGNRKTDPICWLLSTAEGGPELALVDPAKIDPRYALDDVKLDRRLLSKLRCEDPSRLNRYAIVTLPENIKQMSMNLRTPIFIDMESHRGLEYPKPGLEKKPVRCLIYRDLILSRPEDKSGQLVILRKEHETIEIDDDISIQIMDFSDGGVRFGVTAPRQLEISRGDGKLTPLCETKRANKRMDVPQLEEIINMHRIMTSKPENLDEADAQPAAS